MINNRAAAVCGGPGKHEPRSHTYMQTLFSRPLTTGANLYCTPSISFHIYFVDNNLRCRSPSFVADPPKFWLVPGASKSRWSHCIFFF